MVKAKVMPTLILNPEYYEHHLTDRVTSHYADSRRIRQESFLVLRNQSTDHFYLET